MDPIDRNRRFSPAPVPRSSLRRPRLAKIRRQEHSQNLKPSANSKPQENIGMNAFHNQNSNLYTSQPRFGKSGGDGFVFGARGTGIGGNLSPRKLSSNLETTNMIVEEIRNLKLDNENGRGREFKKSFSLDEHVSRLPEDMKNSNIMDSHEYMHTGNTRFSSNKFSIKNENSAVFTGEENVPTSSVKSVEAELPDELYRKLNIRGSYKGDDGSNKLSSDETRKFEFKKSVKSHKSNVKSPSMKKHSGIQDSIIHQNITSNEVNELLSEEVRHKLSAVNITRNSSDETNLGCSSSQTSEKGTLMDNGSEKNVPFVVEPSSPNFSFPGAMQGEKVGQSNMHDVPCTEKTFSFSFSSNLDNKGTPFMEFKAPRPHPKPIPFSSSDQKMELSARGKDARDSKSSRKVEKLKQPEEVQLNLGFQDDNLPLDNSEVSDSYSPMDISPYPDAQHSRRSSEESDVSSSHDKDHASARAVSDDVFDEELTAATGRMDINKVCGDQTEEVSEFHSDKGYEYEDLPEDFVSGAETESFKSAGEEMEASSDSFVTAAETEVCSSLKSERPVNEVPSPCDSDTANSYFTFTASSSEARGPLSTPKRHQKKKNLIKLGNDAYNLISSTRVSHASISSTQFSQFTSALSHLSTHEPHERDTSTYPCEARNNSEEQKSKEAKHQSSLAQEACEKWRLRGNHAYTNGDLIKAEDCYTLGIKSMSNNEMSRGCLRALMLCHSNRAAALISLGRIREALGDCMIAASLDPKFLRVQVRAANCYLALGEIEDATRYFKRCLQGGNDVCVDRKLAVEASEGLQKAKKVSECMYQAAGLLQLRTSNDAEKALEVLSEALSISSFSEKLLEMKAEALLVLQKYEKVIKMCEETFDSAENNSPPFDTSNQLDHLDYPDLPKMSNFRHWRCWLTVKSYFHMGKLEDAISFLERDQNKNFESSSALAATIRELLSFKAAGNEAFQSGRYAEAVEHYTAALSCNVGSRPFTAICFCNRAAAFKALSQITDAIADCSLAIALDRNYLKAISRRATLFEMIRDYGQAANDMQRLVNHLTKKFEEKTSQSGAFDKSGSLSNDLRQARVWLSELEEKSIKEVSLDLYQILGVQPSSSATDIRKAYRKAALRHHPDKAGQSLSRNDNGDDRLWKEIGEEVHRDADRLFKMIGEAYAVLSDPAKRSQYDLEEEMRLQQKKRDGNSTSGAYNNAQNYYYPFEMSSSRRNWREAWRPYGRSGTARWSEATQSNRYPL